MIDLGDPGVPIIVGYIGPGIGMVLQVVIAMGLGSLTLVGLYWKKIIAFFNRRKGGSKKGD